MSKTKENLKAMKEVTYGLKPEQIENLLCMSIATTGGIDTQYMLREKKRMVLSVINHALISHFNEEIFQAVKLNVSMEYPPFLRAGRIVFEARYLEKYPFFLGSRRIIK